MCNWGLCLGSIQCGSTFVMTKLSILYRDLQVLPGNTVSGNPHPEEKLQMGKCQLACYPGCPKRKDIQACDTYFYVPVTIRLMEDLGELLLLEQLRYFIVFSNPTAVGSQNTV